jgi:hypothetical protein
MYGVNGPVYGICSTTILFSESVGYIGSVPAHQSRAVEVFKGAVKSLFSATLKVPKETYLSEISYLLNASRYHFDRGKQNVCLFLTCEITFARLAVF